MPLSDNALTALALREHAQTCDDIGYQSRHESGDRSQKWRDRAQRCRDLAQRYAQLAEAEAHATSETVPS